MVGHLSAGTDAATMVLFDPTAAARALAEMDVVGQEEVETAAASGDLVHWYTAADGSFQLRVYVDEAIPEALTARATNGVSGRLLKVPGGRLVLAGAEMLLDRPEEWDVKTASLELPAGDYVIEAFEVDWSEEDDQAFQRAWRGEAGEFGTRAVMAMEMLTGVLVLVTLGFLIPAVVTLVLRPAGFLQGLIFYGPWLVGAWVMFLTAWRLPPVRRVQAVRDRLQRERPDAVVRLCRLRDEEPRPERGAAFGEGLG